MTAPRRSDGATTASQASAPAQVVVLENPWTKRAAPSVAALPQEKAGDDGALRPEPRGGDAARDPAQQGSGAESTHQNSGADLGQAEVLGIARDERRQRGEEHRVDEDDRADEDEQSAHAVEDMQRLDRRSATTSRLQKEMHRAGGAFVRLSD